MSRFETELLAPAGSIDSLKAALDNGADAVYFGLQSLNARHGAENFKLDELVETVEYIQNHNARAFLTLNIDFTTRDIGKAARILTVAEGAGVDAVLFTDPAILLLKPYFPDMEFHFSTQASITTSEGVKAAKDLGVARVVVAREMSAEEIEIACKIEGVEVEVFTQGALCMCISGRCLLSSWGGGKSGNRGACTSPCRVAWRVTGGTREDILSTQDLSLIEQLPDLVKAGVACLKIEGRLKNAAWVAKAVKLYREVLDGEEQHTKEDTLSLGEYTGRSMTDGYYTNKRHAVFGSGGRIASKKSVNDKAVDSSSSGKNEASAQSVAVTVEDDFPVVFNLSIMSADKSLECELNYNDEIETWTLPKTVIKHKNRGLSVTDAANWLGHLKIQGAALNQFYTDNPEFLVSKKAVNKVADRISAAIHRIKKKASKSAGKEVVLGDKVRMLTKFKERNPNNKFTMTDKPNVARINVVQAEEVLSAIQPERVIVEEADVKDIQELIKLCTKAELIIALPVVFFEYEVNNIKELCLECKKYGVQVEVNGWDGWKIAKDIGVRYSGGVGISILNPLAAEALQSLGFESVAFSLEAGEKQLIDLSRSCPAEAMLTVFSRPVLAHTRADFDDKLDEQAVLRDSRGISLSVHFRGDITELRSTKAFSIGGINSPNIKARWICADLIKSPNPVTEWNNVHKAKSKIVFNFDKGLF